MLTIRTPKQEFYNESTQEFISFDPLVIQLEHSLVSLSKWESKYEKPFLDKAEKTQDEVLDYIQAMIITPDIPDNIINLLTQQDFDDISDYIDAKMTATWFSNTPSKPSREVVTSELIYYWMISFQIPMECQHWHLNRLLTLIRVCSAKSQPAKKMNRSEVAMRNRELNAKRKAQLGSSG